MTQPTPALFELTGGLFDTIDTVPTTPLDELTLPRETAPTVPADSAEQARTMFRGLGWSVTDPK